MDRLPNFFSLWATSARGALQLRAFLFSSVVTEHVELQKSGSGSGCGIVVLYTTY